MKRSDIPDQHVLELAAAWQRDPFEAPPVWDALVAEGIPSKLALAKINHLSDRNLLEWGVSPRCAWPTSRGEQVLKTAAVSDLHDLAQREYTLTCAAGHRLHVRSAGNRRLGLVECCTVAGCGTLALAVQTTPGQGARSR